MESAAEFVKSWMKLTKEWNAELDQALAPGLTSGQLHVLEILREREPMKPSDFLPLLETTPAAVTTLLDRMERGGLVERRRDEQDRRIVWVRMTEFGRREAERGVALRNAIVARSLGRLSLHNRKLLVYLLGKIAGEPGPGARREGTGREEDGREGAERKGVLENTERMNTDREGADREKGADTRPKVEPAEISAADALAENVPAADVPAEDVSPAASEPAAEATV